MSEVILLKVMYLRLLMQDKIIHVKTFTNEYDIEVEWDLTTRCNYSCSYCKSYDNTQPL
jgi:MoaA/NifB/PqqE/SkfB family radical SAM enzyme